MPRSSFFSNLTTQHERARDLVASILIERDPERLCELYREFSETLRRHLEIEEKVLYPKLLEVVQTWEDRLVVLGAHEDHHTIQWSLDEVAKIDPSDERFHGKVHALERLWWHHVEEEEERLYAVAQAHLSLQEFTALADKIRDASRAH